MKEYEQFKGVLKKVAKTYEVKELLTDILADEAVKDSLLGEIFKEEKILQDEYIRSLPPKNLAKQLIEGVLMQKDNLTRFLSKERYSLPPLHNFFFTRDAAMAIYDRVLVGEMANKVRNRESLIMKNIFRNHPEVKSETIAPLECMDCMDSVSIEGGDVLVAGKDILTGRVIHRAPPPPLASSDPSMVTTHFSKSNGSMVLLIMSLALMISKPFLFISSMV